jgi:hypothetical protein
LFAGWPTIRPERIVGQPFLNPGSSPTVFDTRHKGKTTRPMMQRTAQRIYPKVSPSSQYVAAEIAQLTLHLDHLAGNGFFFSDQISLQKE